MRLLAMVLWLLLLPGLSAAGALAASSWPTAGGEGGRIVEVNSRADSGPGTLRAALVQSGPRKIVFRVAGEIFLSRPLLIDKPFVTVAGETAKNPGITILGDKIRIVTHDVILRQIRVRVGEVGASKPENRDGISIEGGNPDRTVARIAIDQCSVAWAVDEGLSIWGSDVRDVAIRNTIVAETLRKSIHPKGDHSMGMMVGPGVKNVLLYRNLLANNVWRNPVIHGGASAMVVNNLIYDPRYAGLHIYPHKGSGPTLVSAVGNMLIAGPSTVRSLPAFKKGVNTGSQIYYQDNTATGTTAFDPFERPQGDTLTPFVGKPPIWMSGISVSKSTEVEALVSQSVGAYPAHRDAVDIRILKEVAGRTGGVKDHPLDPRLISSTSNQTLPAGD